MHYLFLLLLLYYLVYYLSNIYTLISKLSALTCQPVYYNSLLAQFSDVTFGTTGDSIFTNTQEVEAVEENAQGVGEWTPDDVI